MTKYRNTKFSSAMIFSSLVAISSVALAGDVDVIGEDTHVLTIVSNYSGSADDAAAVYATLTNIPGEGIGGYFAGGYAGIRAVAEETGSGHRNAVMGIATGGAYSNRGIYGKATGNEPWAGYFKGNVYTTGEYEGSDERLKEEITDLYDSLDQVMHLKPKSFRFRTKEYPNKNLPEGYHMGLLAQDVEQVFPDLIREVTADEDEYDRGNNGPKTTLAMKYTELIPVLIGAIQEQQEQIAELQDQVAGCGCR